MKPLFLVSFLVLAAGTAAAAPSSFTSLTQCKHWVSDAALGACIDDALDYAQANKESKAELERTAKYIEEFDQVSAAIVYAHMLDLKSDKDAVCNIGRAQGATVQALYSKNTKAHEAGKRLADTCYAKMEEGLREHLSSKHETYLGTVCPLMERHKGLKGLQRKRCEPYFTK